MIGHIFWNKTVEALPVRDIEVLVYDNDIDCVTTGCYTEGKWKVFLQESDYDINISHWAFLPSSPRTRQP